MSLVGIRGIVLEDAELPDCAPFWSNLLFKSFTLGWCPLRPPSVALVVVLDFEVPLDCLSSMGADTERTLGLTPGRVKELAGCLGAVLLPFDRNGRL